MLPISLASAPASFATPITTPSHFGQKPFSVQDAYHTDSVQFSGQSDNRLELAEKLAKLQSLDAPAVLNEIEEALPPILDALKSSGIQISPTLEASLKDKYLQFIQEAKLHTKIATSIVQASADKHSPDELRKLIDIYSDPDTAALIKMQQELTIKAMNSPEAQEGMADVTAKLLDHIFGAEDEAGDQGSKGGFGLPFATFN